MRECICRQVIFRQRTSVHTSDEPHLLLTLAIHTAQVCAYYSRIVRVLSVYYPCIIRVLSVYYPCIVPVPTAHAGHFSKISNTTREICAASISCITSPSRHGYSEKRDYLGKRPARSSGGVSTTGSRCIRSINAESLIHAKSGLIRAIREQNARNPPSGRLAASQKSVILNA